MHNLSILVPDSLHINKKSFASFFRVVEKHKIPIHFVKERQDWIALYGNYMSKTGGLATKTTMLAALPADALFNFNIEGINVFKIARAEIMAFAIIGRHWHVNGYPATLRELFDQLYSTERQTLLLNMAAVIDWMEFWKAKLRGLKGLTHCCVFSGSLIYVKTLIEMLKRTPVRVYVMESFFTGNEYYFEEKYEHIANNSDLRYPSVYNAIKLPEEIEDSDRERVKAINKVILMQNKNVKQPEDSEPFSFPDGAEPLLILGQVVNDFSVLEYKGIGLSTIRFYADLIVKTIRGARRNVIFKCHPWEEKKTHLQGKYTSNALMDILNLRLNAKEKLRFRMVDDFNIHTLFKMCSHCLAKFTGGAGGCVCRVKASTVC